MIHYIPLASWADLPHADRIPTWNQVTTVLVLDMNVIASDKLIDSHDKLVRWIEYVKGKGIRVQAGLGGPSFKDKLHYMPGPVGPHAQPLIDQANKVLAYGFDGLNFEVGLKTLLNDIIM